MEDLPGISVDIPYRTVSPSKVRTIDCHCVFLLTCDSLVATHGQPKGQPKSWATFSKNLPKTLLLQSLTLDQQITAAATIKTLTWFSIRKTIIIFSVKSLVTPPTS